MENIFPLHFLFDFRMELIATSFFIWELGIFWSKTTLQGMHRNKTGHRSLGHGQKDQPLLDQRCWQIIESICWGKEWKDCILETRPMGCLYHMSPTAQGYEPSVHKIRLNKQHLKHPVYFWTCVTSRFHTCMAGLDSFSTVASVRLLSMGPLSRHYK